MIWLLERKKWGGYDTTQGMVVRAANEKQARAFAVSQLAPGVHGEQADFANPDMVTVTRVDANSKGTAVILTDFHAG